MSQVKLSSSSYEEERDDRTSQEKERKTSSTPTPDEERNDDRMKHESEREMLSNSYEEIRDDRRNYDPGETSSNIYMKKGMIEEVKRQEEDYHSKQNYEKDELSLYEEQRNEKMNQEKRRAGASNSYEEERDNKGAHDQRKSKTERAMVAYTYEEARNSRMDKNIKAEETKRAFILIHQDDEEESYQCGICTNNRRFGSLHKAEVHLETHDLSLERRRFKCMVCKKRFITEENLEEHMETTKCRRIETYHCKSCKQQFYSEYDLVGHMKEDHQPYIMRNCDECGEGFQTYEELMNHIGWHRRKKSWECEICGMGMQTYRKCKNHMIGHGEKKFTCKLCQKSFKKGNQLRVHIMTDHTIDARKPDQNKMGKKLQRKEDDEKLELDHERIKQRLNKRIDEIHKKYQKVQREREEDNVSVRRNQDILEKQISRVTKELQVERQKNKNPQVKILKAELSSKEDEVRELRQKVGESYQISMKV